MVNDKQFHDGKYALSSFALLDVWPNPEDVRGVVSREFHVLQTLEYKIWLKGCIPLRMVDHCVQHYSLVLYLKSYERMLLEKLSIDILEQIHQHKDILCWDILELGLSIVVAAVALAQQNGFQISKENKNWGRSLFY
jgi:hypothetical protein